MNPDIFRAYDIRGIFGVDFQPKDFYRIARAFAARFQPKTVALGHDVRESSPQLWQQVADGLQDARVDVLNLGQISTDMLYFAVKHYQTDGGIIISASHNPAAYNGMKLVLRDAVPLSSDNGLFDLRDTIQNGVLFKKLKGHCRRSLQPAPFLKVYLTHLRSFVNWQQLSSKRIVINANSGLAGQIAEYLLAETPIQICARLFNKPDGTFTGIPGGAQTRCAQRIESLPQRQSHRQDQTWQWRGMRTQIGVFSLMKPACSLKAATSPRYLPSYSFKKKKVGQLSLTRGRYGR